MLNHSACHRSEATKMMKPPLNNGGDRSLQGYQSQAVVLADLPELVKQKDPERPELLKRKDPETERQSLQETTCPSSKRWCGKENDTTTVATNPEAPVEDVCKTAGEVLPSSERRRRRKPLHPQRSPSLCDPNFRGVTLCFHTVVHGNSSELIITPIFSKNLSRLQRRRRRLRFNSESEQEGGHSTPEENSTSCDEQRAQASHSHPGGVKSCASCATRRTPLWRDAEDGTPLCNACGIRYRKYRLRCSSCWHIPRKDNKVFPACSQCGGILRFAQARKC